MVAFSGLLVAVGSGIIGLTWLRFPDVLWPLALILLAVVLPIPAASFRRLTERTRRDSEARAWMLENKLPRLLEEAATTAGKRRSAQATQAQKAASMVSTSICDAFKHVHEVRAVVYQVVDSDRMEPVAVAGRHDPAEGFLLSTADGMRAFALLTDKRSFVRVEDASAETGTRLAALGERAMTYIAAPIRSADAGLGMLFVDAAEPGALSLEQCETVALFASTLGVFFALAARPPKPGVASSS